MGVFLSLMGELKKALKLLEKGKMTIATVSDYDNRIVIVLRPPQNKDGSLKTKTIDITSQDPTKDFKHVRNADNPNELKKEKKEPVQPELPHKVPCEHCGRPCSPRGRTRHQNKCNRNPKNLPQMRPRKTRKKKVIKQD
jgi:hypothetical protein